MKEFSKQNNGYNYLLTVIDCLSRSAWKEILSKKTGLEVTKAFAKIFLMGRQPLKLQTDDGKEFYNQQVKHSLDRNKITHFSTYCDNGSCYCRTFQ